MASCDGVLVESFDCEEAARAWFSAELATLLQMIEFAGQRGFTEHMWQLPWAIANYLDRAGHWEELAAMTAVALEAVAEARPQSRIRFSQARAAFRLGQTDTSLDFYLTALALFEEIDDDLGQALTHTNLAGIYGELGRLREASRHCEQALAMFSRLGHRMGQALALNNLGYTLALLGEYPEAMAACHRALALFNEINERPTQAYCFDTLGYVHHRLGDLGLAVQCYRSAIALHEEGGDRLDVAMAFVHLGDANAEAGQPVAAREAWQHALALLTELNHSEAAGVRGRLESEPLSPS
jgi:tetratricopeptide (TPR) repeat protein